LPRRLVSSKSDEGGSEAKAGRCLAEPKSDEGWSMFVPSGWHSGNDFAGAIFTPFALPRIQAAFGFAYAIWQKMVGFAEGLGIVFRTILI
jgi:hypothetical protein